MQESSNVGTTTRIELFEPVYLKVPGWSRARRPRRGCFHESLIEYELTRTSEKMQRRCTECIRQISGENVRLIRDLPLQYEQMDQRRVKSDCFERCIHPASSRTVNRWSIELVPAAWDKSEDNWLCFSFASWIKMSTQWTRQEGWKLALAAWCSVHPRSLWNPPMFSGKPDRMRVHENVGGNAFPLRRTLYTIVYHQSG